MASREVKHFNEKVVLNSLTLSRTNKICTAQLVIGKEQRNGNILVSPGRPFGRIASTNSEPVAVSDKPVFICQVHCIPLGFFVFNNVVRKQLGKTFDNGRRPASGFGVLNGVNPVELSQVVGRLAQNITLYIPTFGLEPIFLAVRRGM